MSEGIKITELIKNKQFSYSFEITPDILLNEIDNLSVDPLFFSVTWHSKTHRCEGLDIAPVKLISELRCRGMNVLLHLSCDMLRKTYLNALLKFLREKGVCNLLVILGEAYETESSDFRNSKELIMYIREHTGNYFCIGVAGFPSRTDNLQQLKNKIDSGANFIITQAVFEVETYRNFVQKCADMGLNVPILPGIFVYDNYKELNRFINLCKVKISDNVLQNIKNDKLFCMETVTKFICDMRKLEYSSKHFHFFTLNKLPRISTFIKTIE